MRDRGDGPQPEATAGRDPASEPGRRRARVGARTRWVGTRADHARAGNAHVPAAAGGGVRQVTSTLEREVKLAASPAFRMPSLDELGDDVLTIPRDPERLQTVYLDTQDFRLARWGVSLRHREGHGWTTKLPTDDDRGDLLIRGEFTFPGEDASNPPDEAVALIR